jgi:hypothetical protein
MEFELAKLLKYNNINLSSQAKEWNLSIRNLKQQKID